MRNIHKIGKELFITYDETAYPYALHLKNQEVLKINGVGEISGELYHDKGFSYPEECKKIILTTDKDLIKDGVQAIDDEFLEWFVKNPSCEVVVVNNLRYGALGGFADAGYKIIIPKKEPKQETLEEAFEKWADQQSEKGVGYDKIDVLQFGAKWQQERMYSEEDMKEAFSMGRTGKTIEDFNIKFKKK